MARKGGLAVSVALAAFAVAALVASCGRRDDPGGVSPDARSDNAPARAPRRRLDSGNVAANAAAGEAPADDPSARPALVGTLRDVEGRVLAGAVMRAAPAPIFPMPDARKAVEVAVGPDGTFDLRSLAAGDWKLLVSIDGAVRAPAGIVRVPDCAEIDVVLPVGATVAGTVSDAESGAPLAGAKVRVIDLNDESVVETTTSAFGKFEARMHREGVWVTRFRVEAPGHCTVPSGFDGDHIEGVGDGERIDVALRLGRGATLRGVVTGPSGPVAGARVNAIIQSKGGETTRTFTTDAAGRYEIANLDPSSVAMLVEADGLVEAAAQRALLRGVDRFFWSCPDECRVEGLPAAGVVEHDVVLVRAEPWPTCSVAGRVLDEQGNAIGGAKVEGGYARPATTTTGADGSFVLDGVISDGETAVIGVSHPAFGSYCQPVDGTVGGRVTDVEFRLPRRPRIHGRVTTTAGDAVAGARVLVVDEDQPGACKGFAAAGPSGPSFQLVETTTGADGTFAVVVELGHGLLTVHAQATGLVAGAVQVNEEQGRVDYTMDVVLPAPVSLAGRVARAGTSEAAGGVTVAVSTEPWESTMESADLDRLPLVVRTVTDADGAFRIDGLAPGRWMLVAGGGAWTTWRGAVVVPRVAALAVEVEPALAISGCVEVGERSPANSVRVTLWPKPHDECVGTDRVGEKRLTGSDGRFVFPGLRPGRYWLRLDGGEPSVQAKTFGPVDAGARVPAIRVERGFVIEGRVIDAEGRGVPKALVCAHDPDADSRPKDNEYASDDGAFRLTGLDGGPYFVYARADGFLVHEVKDIRPGGEPLTLKLDRGLAIEGVLIGHDGTALPRHRIRAELVDAGAGAASQYAETDDDGRFRVTGLTKGRWRLTDVCVYPEDAEPMWLPLELTVEAGATGVRAQCAAPKHR